MVNNQVVLETLESKKRELQKQLSEIEDALQFYKTAFKATNELKAQPQVETSTLGVYNNRWTIKEKVIFALKAKNRFSHVRELGDYIKNMEDPNGQDFQKFIDMVKQQLHPLKKEGIIVSYMVDNQLRKTFWGSPKWMEGGKIKPGYEYNKKFLKLKKEIEI